MLPGVLTSGKQQQLQLQRERAAHHEAGHALAAFARELPVVSASITTVRSGFFFTSWSVEGFVDAKDYDDTDDQLIAAAGIDAEALWTAAVCGGSFKSRRRAAVYDNPSDAGKVRDLVRLTALTVDAAYAWSYDLLVEQWGAVEAMAAALLEDGFVSGRDLARLL